MANDTTKKEAEKKKRAHKASYATDKKKGGYLIRVAGPNANQFAGREVPVSMKNSNEEHMEKLVKLIWSGKDQETGENVALYAFEAKPREEKEVEF